MKERIQQVLQNLKIQNWLINLRTAETAELFLIRRELDTRRIKDVTDASVTVYRDFTQNGKEYRGSSAVVLSPDMTEEEMKQSLSDAYEAAQHVKNPMFELYEGPRDPQPQVSGISGSLSEIAAKMADALFSADRDPEAFLNSAEIFVNRTRVRTCSSTGTDVSYEKTECEGEFVVQCKEPLDVEQHVIFSYETADTEALRQKAIRALAAVRDRAHAKKSPAAGTYDIVLSGEHVATILSYYLARSDAGMVYAKYSDYRPGANLQGTAGTGERLNLTVLPSAPYSPEGIPMPRRNLIQNGELCFLHGSVRFCRYLGIEPTGSYSKILLENGTLPFEEMKKGCLYPVTFSDFQMDEFSGHFGGEIRLAYLCTENGVEILTGGSINGSLIEKQGDLVFSTDRYQSAEYEGPMAVRIPAVRVAGIS